MENFCTSAILLAHWDPTQAISVVLERWATTLGVVYLQLGLWLKQEYDCKNPRLICALWSRVFPKLRGSPLGVLQRRIIVYARVTPIWNSLERT